jgi:hypothetical protein
MNRQAGLGLAVLAALVVSAYLAVQARREPTLAGKDVKVADEERAASPTDTEAAANSALEREASRVEVPAPASEVATTRKAEPEATETWQERYSKFTLGQVVDESRSLRASIDEISMPYYQDRFDHGAYEVIGTREPGKPYDVPTEEFDELCTVTFFKDGTVARVTLPRDEFPEAYEMREKVAWLADREDVLKRRPLTDFKLKTSR